MIKTLMGMYEKVAATRIEHDDRWEDISFKCVACATGATVTEDSLTAQPAGDVSEMWLVNTDWKMMAHCPECSQMTEVTDFFTDKEYIFLWIEKKLQHALSMIKHESNEQEIIS